MTQHSWTPLLATPAAIHFCDLCQFTGNSVANYTRHTGNKPHYPVSAASNMSVWVPVQGIIYVCPTNITHYIDVHGFLPPREFCEAVLRCPPMRTMEYSRPSWAAEVESSWLVASSQTKQDKPENDEAQASRLPQEKARRGTGATAHGVCLLQERQAGRLPYGTATFSSGPIVTVVSAVSG